MSFANKLIFFLLCALIVTTTLAYGTVHQPIIAFFYILIAAIPILWAVDAFMSGSVRFSKNLIQVPLFATFVFGLLQIIPFGALAETAGVADIPRTISLDPFATKVSALHFLALAIFLTATLAYTDSAKRLQKLATVVTVFGFAFAFFAILQVVLSPTKIYGIYEVRNGSPFGSFVNRNNFAAFMEMTLAVPLGLFFVGGVKKDKRLLYLTAIVLMGVALILSGSRGGFIALLAQIVFLVILTAKSKTYGQIALKVGLSVLLVGAIIAGSIFVGGETSSLTRFAESGTIEATNTNRTHIWEITLDVIKNHPIVGAGLGAFGVAYPKYDNYSGLERVEQAHNDYLQVLSDAGIVGLLIGAFFVFQLFRSGLENIKSDNTFRRGIALGALAGCFSIFVHSIFDFVLHTTAIAVMFLTLVAMVVAAGREYADDLEEVNPRRLQRRSGDGGRETRSGNAATITPISEARRRRGESE